MINDIIQHFSIREVNGIKEVYEVNDVNGINVC